MNQIRLIGIAFIAVSASLAGTAVNQFLMKKELDKINSELKIQKKELFNLKVDVAVEKEMNEYKLLRNGVTK